ncbi:hypothetical protein ACFRKD_32240 [Streptomyces niveus]|uniref:hypothetical protein n=1 Tax=Streptomyces niveus TaxID=193462 RepID=UPI0036C3E6D2
MLAAGAMGVGALMLSTGTAHAGNLNKIVLDYYDERPVGTVQFTANGDKLKVCDTRADGFAVTVKVLRSFGDLNNPVWTVRNGLGKGWCVNATKNLDENHRYYFWSVHRNRIAQVGNTTAG